MIHKRVAVVVMYRIAQKGHAEGVTDTLTRARTEVEEKTKEQEHHLVKYSWQNAVVH